jgi:hypothetical protein
MLHRGEVIIPPSCPAIDGEWQLCDIRTANIRFYVNDYGVDDDGRPGTEAWFSFFAEGERAEEEPDEPTLELRIMTVPVGSPDSRVLHAFGAAIKKDGGERLEGIRTMMCDRIAVCRGVVNGECWAVGQRAIMEMIKPPGGEPDKSV